MIGCDHPTTSQEFWSIIPIQLEIARQSARGLFDIGSRLVESEGEPIELRRNFFGNRLISLRGGFQRCSLRDILRPAQYEESTFFNPHFSNLDETGDCTDCPRARCQYHMTVISRRDEFVRQLNVIGVVEDE